MEEEGPANFNRNQLHFNSDEHFSTGGHSYSANLQYDEVFQCCSDTHDGGQVITQILWDLREGIGGIPALGKNFVDKLVVMTTPLLVGQVETMELLYASMIIVASVPLAPECPIGNFGVCAGAVMDAFARHGVCVTGTCDESDYNVLENESDADTFCNGSVCFRNNEFATTTVMPAGGDCLDFGLPLEC